MSTDKHVVEKTIEWLRSFSWARTIELADELEVWWKDQPVSADVEGLKSANESKLKNLTMSDKYNEGWNKICEFIASGYGLPSDLIESDERKTKKLLHGPLQQHRAYLESLMINRQVPHQGGKWLPLLETLADDIKRYGCAYLWIREVDGELMEVSRLDPVYLVLSCGHPSIEDHAKIYKCVGSSEYANIPLTQIKIFRKQPSFNTDGFLPVSLSAKKMFSKIKLSDEYLKDDPWSTPIMLTKEQIEQIKQKFESKYMGYANTPAEIDEAVVEANEREKDQPIDPDTYKFVESDIVAVSIQDFTIDADGEVSLTFSSDPCPQGHDKLEGDCRYDYCRCGCERCKQQCEKHGR